MLPAASKHGLRTHREGRAPLQRIQDTFAVRNEVRHAAEQLQGHKEVKYTSAPLTVSVNEAQKTAETLKAGDQVWSLNLILFCWLYNQRFALKNGFF